jgi:hypothetical protein
VQLRRIVETEWLARREEPEVSDTWGLSSSPLDEEWALKHVESEELQLFPGPVQEADSLTAALPAAFDPPTTRSSRRAWEILVMERWVDGCTNVAKRVGNVGNSKGFEVQELQHE